MKDSTSSIAKLNIKNPSKIISKTTKSEETTHNGHRQTTKEFICNKREVFYLQYTLALKNKEIETLSSETATYLSNLEYEEQKLRVETSRFDVFLKDSDRECAEVLKRADMEVKAKMEKIQECKTLQTKVTSSKGQIANMNDHFADLTAYREFLNGILAIEVISGLSEEEQFKKQFTDPDVLLTVFTDLEERNLALIQACQEAESTSEDLNARLVDGQALLSDESSELTSQIDRLKDAITKESEKSRQLAHEDAASSKSHDAQMQQLKPLILQTHRSCTKALSISNDLTLLETLRDVETHLEYLLNSLESMPITTVRDCERNVEKNRRADARSEKIHEAEMAQQERVKKALARSLAVASDTTKSKTKKVEVRRRLIVATGDIKKKKKTVEVNADDINAYFSDTE